MSQPDLQPDNDDPDPADLADFADAESADLTDFADTADSADPADSVDPAEFADLAKLADPVDHAALVTDVFAVCYPHGLLCHRILLSLPTFTRHPFPSPAWRRRTQMLSLLPFIVA